MLVDVYEKKALIGVFQRISLAYKGLLPLFPNRIAEVAQEDSAPVEAHDVREEAGFPSVERSGSPTSSEGSENRPGR